MHWWQSVADSIQGAEKRPEVRHSSSGLSSPRAEVVPGEQDVAAGRRAAVTHQFICLVPW